MAKPTCDKAVVSAIGSSRDLTAKIETKYSVLLLKVVNRGGRSGFISFILFTNKR